MIAVRLISQPTCLATFLSRHQVARGTFILFFNEVFDAMFRLEGKGKQDGGDGGREDCTAGAGGCTAGCGTGWCHGEDWTQVPDLLLSMGRRGVVLRVTRTHVVLRPRCTFPRHPSLQAAGAPTLPYYPGEPNSLFRPLFLWTSTRIHARTCMSRFPQSITGCAPTATPTCRTGQSSLCALVCRVDACVSLPPPPTLLRHRLCADSEPNVQNAVQFLDALIKDIAADCTHWDVAAFIPKVRMQCAQAPHRVRFLRWHSPHPRTLHAGRWRRTQHLVPATPAARLPARDQSIALKLKRQLFHFSKLFLTQALPSPPVPLFAQLRDYLRVTNPHKRQFLLSWVVVLDSLPHVHMLRHLPALLDGLLSMLAEPVREVRTQAANCLKVRSSARRRWDGCDSVMGNAGCYSVLADPVRVMRTQTAKCLKARTKARG